MTRFLLVRHGQSMANLEAVFAGNYDVDLTDLGHKQAECTAEFISKNYQVDALYSSDLRRAYQTGEHASAKLGLEIQKEPGMREIFAGEWEGALFSQLPITHPKEYEMWVTDIGNSRCPEGETVADLAQRVYDTLTRMAQANPGKTVLVTTHATPIRTVQWRMTGKPLSHMKDIPWVSNASVTELIYEDGKLIPVKISQDSHLAELKTSLPANV